MPHTCKACGKSEAETRFATQDGNNRPRSMCNLCRSVIDRAKRENATKQRDYVGWMNLCADSRPDWQSLKRQS